MKNASESSLRRLEQRGLEGRNNKKEVDGVSDTTEVEYDDISSSEEGSDREEEIDDNEEGSEPVDQLYNLYYKKVIFALILLYYSTSLTDISV